MNTVKKMKNILVLNHESIYPPRNGVQIAIFSMAKLISTKNLVTIFSWGRSKSYIHTSGNIKIIHVCHGISNDLLHLASEKHKDSIFLNIFRAFNFSQLGCILSTGPHYKTFLKYVDEKFDVIIKVGPDNNKIAQYLSKKYKMPVIDWLLWVGSPWYIDNLLQWRYFVNDIKDRNFANMNFRIQKLMDYFITKLEVHNLSRGLILTVSPLDQMKVKKELPRRNIDYIYPTVIEQDVSNIDERDKVFMDKYKPYGIFFTSPETANTFTIKTLISLFSEILDINILIVGGSMHQNLQLPSNIKIVGYLRDAVFDYTILNALFIVFPLMQGHGIQMKLIKALSYGKPIIATSAITKPFSGLTNKKQIIIEDDPNNFREEILEVIKNEQLRNELSKNARTYYEDNLSNRANLEKIIEFIEKLTDQNNLSFRKKIK